MTQFIPLVNILFTVVCMVWAVMFFDNLVRSKFFIDKDNRIIFYPNDTKTGYSATPEQIDECAKAFKKCFLFNITGYKKDIERIFANSEKIETPMPTDVFQKNQAQRASWKFLIFWIVLGLVMLISIVMLSSQKIFIFLPIFAIVQALTVVLLKLKNK